MKKRSDHIQLQQFDSWNVCFFVNHLLAVCFVFSLPGCFAFWCFPCFACVTTKKYGQCLCLPLLDYFGFIPAISLSMRVSMRQRYGIKVRTKLFWPSDTFAVASLMSVVSRSHLRRKHSDVVTLNVPVLPLQGDMCNDCLCATFCTACSWCQMSREMKQRNIQVLLVSAKNTWSPQPKLHRHAVMTYDFLLTS